MRDPNRQIAPLVVGQHVDSGYAGNAAGQMGQPAPTFTEHQFDALVVWIVPWMVGQAFLRPYLLAEHTACAFTRDCLENTRTTLTWPLVRLFAWNMPYHAEHHAYPAIPCHALPRLHARVRDKIENLEPGYVRASVKVARYLTIAP